MFSCLLTLELSTVPARGRTCRVARTASYQSQRLMIVFITPALNLRDRRTAAAGLFWYVSTYAADNARPACVTTFTQLYPLAGMVCPPRRLSSVASLRVGVTYAGWPAAGGPPGGSGAVIMRCRARVSLRTSPESGARAATRTVGAWR